MSVFEVRKSLIADCRKYVLSFVKVADQRLEEKVALHFEASELWPEPLLQFNPSLQRGKSIDDLVDESILHQKCRAIFRVGKTKANPGGKTMRLHAHQEEASRLARTDSSYVLTTGTGL